MRGLLRDFASRGGTVLLSSHLFHEVEAIADHFVIIAGGRIVAQGTPEELVGGHARTRVRSADDDVLRRALRSHSIEVSLADDGALLADASADAVSDVALAAGVAVRELRATGDGPGAAVLPAHRERSTPAARHRRTHPDRPHHRHDP